MKLKLSLLLIIITFIFTSKAFAAECVSLDANGNCIVDSSVGSTNAPQSNAITSTSGTDPYADSMCGYAYPNEYESNKCCVFSKSASDLNKILSGESWGCVSILLTKVCFSDFIAPATTIYKSLSSLIAYDGNYPQCRTGKALGEGDACICSGVTDRKMCDRYLAGSSEAGDCSTCMSGDAGYYSALGCIKLNSFGGLITGGILTPLLSLGGLAAFLIIIYSAILIMTSSGEPEKIKKAKEMLTSALVGLLFIILSIFILKFISGDLLGISLKGGK